MATKKKTESPKHYRIIATVNGEKEIILKEYRSRHFADKLAESFRGRKGLQVRVEPHHKGNTQ